MTRAVALAKRHGPFLAAVAGAPPHSAKWYRYQAGLMTLELADRVWSTRRAIAVGESRLLPIERAILTVRHAATRKALLAIVKRVAPGGAPSKLVLIDFKWYAECLASDGEFALAAYVDRTVIDVATKEGLLDLLPDACEHAGSRERELGHMEVAFELYRRGHAIATQLHDRRAVLRIAVARANLHRVLGRNEQARDILDPALSQARALRAREIIARAAHERGIVARHIGSSLEALDFYAEAFAAYTDARQQYRLLNDIGLGLKSLGHVEDARATWLVVSLLAEGDRDAGWVANINLMECARENHDPVSFDQHARPLAHARMQPRLLVEYLLEYGHGCALFERRAKSRRAYKRAARIAEEHGLQTQYQTALDALNGRSTSAAPIPDAPVALPTRLTALVDEIRARRSLPALLGRSYAGDGQGPPIQPLRTQLRRGRPRKLEVR